MPVDTRSCPELDRRSGVFPGRARTPHPHARFRTAEPLRGLSRGAGASRRPRLRPVAPDEMDMVVPADPSAGHPLDEAASRKVALSDGANRAPVDRKSTRL